MTRSVYTQWSSWIRYVLALGLILVTHYSLADILDLPSAKPATSTIPMPVRGQTMDEVLAQFGEALEVTQPIGNPPITRWKYPKYSVVFERQYVIHSVLHRDLPGTD